MRQSAKVKIDFCFWPQQSDVKLYISLKLYCIINVSLHPITQAILCNLLLCVRVKFGSFPFSEPSLKWFAAPMWGLTPTLQTSSIQYLPINRFSLDLPGAERLYVIFESSLLLKSMFFFFFCIKGLFHKLMTDNLLSEGSRRLIPERTERDKDTSEQFPCVKS